jgi:hypothetical protein
MCGAIGGILDPVAVSTTAPRVADTRAERIPLRATLARVGVPGLLALLVLLAGWLVVSHPTAAKWDQQALLAARFEAPHYPAPALGFSSQLLVAVWHALSPLPESSWNEQIKILALVLYAGAATLLASALLRRRGLLVAFLLLLFASQYPLLWLSSELFAGALLCLALWARITARPTWLLGLLLALLGLAKPDVMLVSLALLCWWVARASRAEGIALVGSFAGWTALLLAPGLLASGLDYFHTYNRGAGGRSFASFRQHHAVLIAPLQVLGPPPDPWNQASLYFDRIFPGAQSMTQVVTQHFPRYVEFVALSCARGLLRAGWVLNYAALALPLLAVGARRTGRPTRFGESERTLLLCFIGILPFVLFSFPHVRYFARFYPLFLILVLGAAERLHERGDAAARPWLGLVALCLGLSLAENAGRLARTIAALPQASHFWFPD